MKELEQTVLNALNNIVVSGAIEKAIEEKLQKTVISVIESELREYSDFGKQISEHVKKSLNADLKGLSLPGYNDLILKLIRKQVDAHTGHAIAQQIEQQMASLLAPPPAEIKLSELVEQFKKKFGPDPDECHCGPIDERMTLIIKQESGRFSYICMDKEDRKSEYQCAIRIGLHCDEIFTLKLDGKDAQQTLFIGPLYDFERSLFQMYVAKTKLIIDGDEDSIDTAYEIEREYD